MITDHFFRKAVIDAGLELTRHLSKYEGLSVESAIRQLRAGPTQVASLDYAGASVVINEIGLGVFRHSNDRTVELRDTILALAMQGRPFWARIAPLGRSKVASVLNDNQKQCLESARLLETPPDNATVEWWDALARAVRSTADESKQELGRLGEQWTMSYEQERLHECGIYEVSPVWVAVDDNTAGYDVRSLTVDSSGTLRPLLIVGKDVVPNTEMGGCFRQRQLLRVSHLGG